MKQMPQRQTLTESQIKKTGAGGMGGFRGGAFYLISSRRSKQCERLRGRLMRSATLDAAIRWEMAANVRNNTTAERR